MTNQCGRKICNDSSLNELAGAWERSLIPRAINYDLVGMTIGRGNCGDRNPPCPKALPEGPTRRPDSILCEKENNFEIT